MFVICKRKDDNNNISIGGNNMGTILYEATISGNFIIVGVLFLVFFLFVITFPQNIIKFSEKHNLKYNETEKQARKSILIVLLLICLGFIVFIYSSIDMYINVVGEYKKGEYEVTEGYVEDFIPIGTDGNNRESFSINGIKFKYSDSTVQSGYCKVAKNGGVVYENGQHLKIGYVQYGSYGNVIVYIEDLSGIE